MDDQELQDIIDGVMRFTCSLCGARTWAPRKLLERIPKGLKFMLGQGRGRRSNLKTR